jgi:hypothetical protein
MDAMYLSDKKNGIARQDHEELEVLLESFSKQVEEIVNEAENIEVSSSHIFRIPELINRTSEQCSVNTGNSRAYIRLQPKSTTRARPKGTYISLELRS